MFYAIVNVLTGELVETSHDPLSVEGYPLQVRTYPGHIPDPARCEWNPAALTFEPVK